MAGHFVFSKAPIPQVGEHLKLPPEEAHHLSKVLRVRTGDPVTLLNGSGLRTSCKLLDSETLEVIKEENVEPPTASITLAVAIPKPKHFEILLQKAAEIGCSVIQPLISARTEHAHTWDKKFERCKGILTEACKQSGNAFLPALKDPVAFEDFVETDKSSLKLIASLEPDAKRPETQSADSITLLVGPEGDFTKDEYQLAKESGYAPIRLARNVLRVETAAIYALSVLDYLIQD